MGGRGLRFVVGLLAYSGLVVACSGSFSSIPAEKDAAGEPTPPVANTDGAMDAAAAPVTDAAPTRPDGDAGDCNSVEPKAGPKPARSVVGAPPTPRGGPLVSGTFDMIEVVVYRGESFPVSVESAMEMDATNFRMTSRALGATSRLAGTYKPSGTRIRITPTCSNGISIVADDLGYTSEKSGEVVKLYGSFEGRDLEYVFQKR